MEIGHEKVCTRCGTLNDERSLMCVRCGETLEMSEENRYKTFKGKMLNEKLFLFLFMILFLFYSSGMIFYVSPWLQNQLLLLSEKYLIGVFGNSYWILVSLEIIYTIFLSVANYIAIAIILYSVLGTKLMKKSQLNSSCIIIYVFMILSFMIMSIYQHKLNYTIIIEHFMSLIMTFSYIKMKILKRSN